MAQSFKRFLFPLAAAVITVGAALVPRPSLGAQGPDTKYPKDLPAALVKQAKVSEADAARKALAAVPNGEIKAVELESEGGRLIYSYELKVKGHAGIEEVNVNAVTGVVVNTEHEGAAAERNEAAHERGTPEADEGSEAGEAGEPMV